MKKIDKLIVSAFLGPFVLTFLVVVFILLNINMIKYFDDIIGKDLGWGVIGELFFYFAIFNVPIALPLAVLLSSLITFGNLGEHFELTAIKSLGVSLTRALVPILVLVIFITGIAYLANNYMVPKAALEAYSLLYDIKQKKPALDLKEGAFYGAIPEVNIKVNHKYPDGVSLKGVVIYDHRGRSGNREVTVADSGRMYTILNSRYLKLELFEGYNYSEGSGSERDMTGQPSSRDTFSKTRFKKTYVVFDLSSFNLQQTEKKWFKGNRIMRNVTELDYDMDSVRREMDVVRLGVFDNAASSATSLTRSFNIEIPMALMRAKRVSDSLAVMNVRDTRPPQAIAFDTSRNNRVTIPQRRRSRFSTNKLAIQDSVTTARVTAISKTDSLLAMQPQQQEISSALNSARSVKSLLTTTLESMKSLRYELNVFHIQWHKIFANSVACFVMFLIGAPLGAIIKRGGLGVPVLVSIIFFILFYVLSLLGEKWAKQDAISVPVGIWAANAILLVFGLLFLRQARLDARLFDSDFYLVVAERIKRRFKNRMEKPTV